MAGHVSRVHYTRTACRKPPSHIGELTVQIIPTKELQLTMEEWFNVPQHQTIEDVAKKKQHRLG